jgi:glutathione S-transferase
MIKPDQPFIVHHIEGRRSERVAWLCEELGLPYELKFVSGDVGGSLRALAKAHVMRMAPILEDGPVKMVESGAILEYILVRYGGGRLRPPPDSPEMADYLQWMHFAEGSGMFRAMMERLARQLAGDKPPPDVAFLYVGSSKRVLDFAEAALASRPYFAGTNFSAADIMMHFPLRLAPLALQRVTAVTPLFHDDRTGLAHYPNVDAFLDRMAARPAFQRAMAVTLPNGPPAM